MRKLILAVFAIILISVSSFSQAPDSLKYQAIVRNAAGYLIADQAVGLEISILQGNIAGIVVYTETHTATSNAFGLVNLIIGGGTSTLGTFAAIDWSAGPYFVKVGLDPDGGTTYSTIMGTSQLLSVPYALHSQTADEVTAKTYSIGDVAHGGIVFYVNSIGTHGLVAANKDQYLKTDGKNWYEIQNELNNPSKHDMEGAKFLDWRLPTLWELGLMYMNLHQNGDGGFVDDWYWSSTQALGSDVLEGIDPAVIGLNFSDGSQDNEEPDNTVRFFTRSVRVF